MGHESENGSAIPKKCYDGGRNTTELTAKDSKPEVINITSNSGSPRLERAHSEPPKFFNQRLLRNNNPLTGAPPIPENLETQPDLPVEGWFESSTRLKQEDQNPIKTSASAPSMVHPNSSLSSHKYKGTGNMFGGMANKDQYNVPLDKSHKSSPLKESAKQKKSEKVRHIPIFVEGQNEPMFSRKFSQSESQQNIPGSGKFPYPSDYYPASMNNNIKTSTILDREKIPPNLYSQEPTSPLDLLIGAIPMGYTPNSCKKFNQNTIDVGKEPTSPINLPVGPIPMPCSPSLMAKDNEKLPFPREATNENVDECMHNVPTIESVNEIHLNIPKTPKDEQKEEKNKISSTSMNQLHPAYGKLEMIEEEVSALKERIENFKGSKTDKEY